MHYLGGPDNPAVTSDPSTPDILSSRIPGEGEEEVKEGEESDTQKPEEEKIVEDSRRTT